MAANARLMAFGAPPAGTQPDAPGVPGMPSPGATPDPNAMMRLAELAQQMVTGQITQQEFEARKTEILGG
jgi:hypothetical protein